MEVTLIDHMGTDLSVVNAARVSFNKESELEWVQKMSGGYYDLSDRDEKLIRYLATHDHFTPFTHCQITLRERVPIFVARQRFKHTVGFSYNEVSRRYVDDKPEFFHPVEWRAAPENMKQGSSDKSLTILDDDDYPVANSQEWCDDRLQAIHNTCEMIYDEFIRKGVAPEQARMVLPQSMYTEYYVTGSLAAFARAYKLRSDSHAQKEIQDLALEWDRIIRDLFPVSWSALIDD